MADINKELRDKIIQEIPELKKCFQCGTCTSSCPAKIYSGHFSPRELILQCLRGMQEEILDDNLWRCITCNSCNERCPQDVNPYEVIVKLKNIAVREGMVSEERRQAMSQAFDMVIDTGFAYPANELVRKRRQEQGLDEHKDVSLGFVKR